MMSKRPVSSRVKSLMAVGTAVVGFTSLAVVYAGPAFADPAVVFVAVGSDTSQDVINQFSYDIGANELGSYNAVNPVTAVADENITPVIAGSPTANCSFTRPNGSGQGLSALRKSINQSTTAAQLTDPPQAGCIQIGRSSSGPGTNQANDGSLVYIPFAYDNVSGVVAPTSHLTTANDFTETDLINLYKNCQNVTEGGVTYNPNTATTGQQQIDLYVPQPGSGTLSFWATTLGFSATSLPTCVHQTIVGTTTLVEENDGTAVTTDLNGYMPFSVGQWISQRNGHDDRRHGAVETDVNGVSPFVGGNSATGSLSYTFPINREIYNIVQYSVITGTTASDEALAALLLGQGSALCSDGLTIASYGFAPLNSSTTDQCGSDANSLRAFDPSTNPV
jgi:hypothetical protein